jgi:hypothetical protein
MNGGTNIPTGMFSLGPEMNDWIYFTIIFYYTYDYMKYIILSLLSMILFISCDDKIVCDASLKYNTVYSPDTLIFYEVEDLDRDSIIYRDSNVIGDIPVIDDSYLSVIGSNNTVGLNIRYFPKGGNLHVVGFCAFSDDCHISIPRGLDTLITR